MRRAAIGAVASLAGACSTLTSFDGIEPRSPIALVDGAPDAEIDLRADLDDLIGRQLEVRRRMARVAREDGEDRLLDLAHLSARTREHGLATQEIRDVVDVGDETGSARFAQEGGHVG